MLVAANHLFVMSDDPTPLARARRGIDNLLGRLAAKDAPHGMRVGGNHPAAPPVPR